jgi:Flp pilus assembly protein TadD
MPSVDESYDQAIALQEKGDLDAAIAKLESILAESPDHALSHSALSVFYGKLERFDEAVEHAQRVCQIEPDDPFSFVAMSLICQKAGRLAEAEDASMQARRLQFSGS